MLWDIPGPMSPFFASHMDVKPKIGGKQNPPKWMVKIMENPIKMDDLGGTTFFWKHPYLPYFKGFLWEWYGSSMGGWGSHYCRSVEFLLVVCEGYSVPHKIHGTNGIVIPT